MPTPTASSDKSTAASRGRNVASKPLNAAAASAASKSKTATPVSATDKTSRTPSESSNASVKSLTSARNGKVGNEAASTSRTPSETGFKVTKLSSSTVTLQTTWSPKPISEPPKTAAASSSGPAPTQPSTNASDPLQLAAQVYPWAYMSSTLDACFDNAETTAKNDLEGRAKELAAEESETADKRERLEAERAIEFYDELGSDAFATKAPAIMKLFHSHGDACNRIETEALKLAMRDAPDPPEDEPLKVYQDMLSDLEELHTEATSLQESIIELTESTATSTDEASQQAEDVSSARSQVTGVFSACLPVLRARIANLSMAQELIDSALENVSLGLRMESMGLND
ncbi:hypothetical protein CPC08DRAFT_703305 [Agrocybe pediades]|nr:hypothetical protein CPC08DRAFT_703305 [Agrocybe pediades]